METTPDGIPDDIWASAMIEAAKYVEWAFQTRNVDADAEHVLATSISRMVLAERLKERESCAAIADAVRADIEQNPHDGGPMDAGGIRAAEKTAQFIRSRP